MSMQRIVLQMRSLAAATLGEFEKWPKIRYFFFAVRNWMCGVSACENMRKRGSHGETVRVGSSAVCCDWVKRTKRRHVAGVPQMCTLPSKSLDSIVLEKKKLSLLKSLWNRLLLVSKFFEFFCYISLFTSFAMSSVQQSAVDMHCFQQNDLITSKWPTEWPYNKRFPLHHRFRHLLVTYSSLTRTLLSCRHLKGM